LFTSRKVIESAFMTGEGEE